MTQPTAMARAAYLVAMVPFLFLWLLSHGHLNAMWLLVPAVLCATQAVRPTPALWVLIFLAYLWLGGLYGFLLLTDLIALASGKGRPQALVDFDDSVVFIALEVSLIGLVFWLWKVRPKSVHDSGANPFSDPDRL